MKTSIFYFSGTGNSLKVALDLAKELGDAETHSISKALQGNLSLSSDSIGIVFPVYMFGPPLIVCDFIKKLNTDCGKYIFAVATCGGMSAGTLKHLEKILKEQALKLSAGFIIKMPGNYTPLYGAIDTKKQNAMFFEEEKKIKEIARSIKEKERKIEKDTPVLISSLFSVLYRFASPKIPGMDSEFWSDEKCNGCRVCENVCPVSNIKITDGRPVWLHKCQQCFACLQWCPQEAIQYKKSTISRKRYRNPNIKLNDYIAQK